MQITDTDIPGVKIVDPGRHADERGWLSELWNPGALEQAGLPVAFDQDNLTYSAETGVVRALHFQVPPFVQGKLISCLTGTIYDVAVDLRVGSPTFGHHVAVTLRAEDSQQLWVPPGFAHGYCSMTPDTRVFYKLTAPYHAESMGGLLWRDRALEIAWPVAAGDAIVHPRDDSWPTLADLDSPFRFND
tara:strand:- start:87952 stop:88515 length:564 start_codon:yes stop_codon:yes gene_type:complete